MKQVGEDYIKSQPEIENVVDNSIIQIGGEMSDTVEDNASRCSEMDTDMEIGNCRVTVCKV